MDQSIFEGTSSKVNSFFSSSSPPPPIPGQPSPSSPPPDDNKSDKYKEMEENVMRQEKELRENIRDLLSCLAQRDQIYAASRKAYQKLNKECKLLIYTTLKKIVEREKESLLARQTILEKLEEKVNCIDIDQDESEFIESHIGEYSNQGELLLQSQALSILGDIHILDRQHQEMRNTMGESNPFDEPEKLEGGSTQMDQTHEYFSRIFYLSDWNVRGTVPNSTPSEILSSLKIKAVTQRGSLTQQTDDNGTDQSTSLPVNNDFNEIEEAIYKLCQLCDTTEGRKLFVNVLNQFRSKKVEVGLGFSLLGAVVWYLLTKCLHVNDVHNAKIIMILSQVLFYLSID